ncbi:tellurite resistance TerB family protein [Yoonia sp. F2084L]|uniref:DUF533 domain-containing protein n=1 Tax=Yoonia sp. F2084L TaxID=2926419 RepID=UPI001FF59F24|nr:DUF533 domain-containing protein [Yoonia sp. F2084L]MCK0097565.1 tellurite resistance TerB family protein [Yoonia sp. F2084L]
MSLMNTVTKMALGFAMAKGMDAMKKNGGLGEMLGGLTGGGSAAPQQASGMGGLGDMLGQLGGGGPASGGLGGMLGQLTGGGGSTGGLGDMLGQLGGGGAAAGGLGGLGALLGGLAGARGGAAGGGLEAMLNQDNPADEPDEDEVATLMLRAMTQAARADGDLDAGEKAKLTELLSESDPGTMEVLQDILSSPVSAAGLAADTPKGLETQVYTMSVNAITPDNKAEAQYLHDLASGLEIQPQTANAIHDSLGAPRLYS